MGEKGGVILCSRPAWLWWLELSSLQLSWSSLTIPHVPHPSLATARLVFGAWESAMRTGRGSISPGGTRRSGRSQGCEGVLRLLELPPCMHLSCFLGHKPRLGASTSARFLLLWQLCPDCWLLDASRKCLTSPQSHQGVYRVWPFAGHKTHKWICFGHLMASYSQCKVMCVNICRQGTWARRTERTSLWMHLCSVEPDWFMSAAGTELVWFLVAHAILTSFGLFVEAAWMCHSETRVPREPRLCWVGRICTWLD